MYSDITNNYRTEPSLMHHIYKTIKIATTFFKRIPILDTEKQNLDGIHVVSLIGKYPVNGLVRLL